MATRAEPRGMPYGIGHLSLGWVSVIVVLLALVALGSFAYARQVTQGEIVTGLRDVGAGGGAAWGLYIAFELYVVGVGFGSMILLGLGRLMGITHLQPLGRTLGLMALAALTVGGLSVVTDVGQPLRAIVNLLRYARPMSAFFGTFTIGVVTSLLAVAAYLYLDSRRDAALLARRPSGWSGFLRLISAGYRGSPGEEGRHRQTKLVMHLLLLVLGVAAASTSGFVFSVQLGRAGWYSALQAPAFLVLAGVSATGMLIIVAAFLRGTLGAQARLEMPAFRWLNNLLVALTLTYLYFTVAEFITMGYEGHHHEERLRDALFTGSYAWLFWLSISLMALAFLLSGVQALTKRYSLSLIVLAGLLANLAAIGKRYLIVVPSLTDGNLLPYSGGSYSPSWVEYVVVIGLLALGALLYIGFMKVFPIMDVSEKQ